MRAFEVHQATDICAVKLADRHCHSDRESNSGRRSQWHNPKACLRLRCRGWGKSQVTGSPLATGNKQPLRFEWRPRGGFSITERCVWWPPGMRAVLRKKDLWEQTKLLYSSSWKSSLIPHLNRTAINIISNAKRIQDWSLSHCAHLDSQFDFKVN